MARDHNVQRSNGQGRAQSSDVQAKLDILIEAAIARGRVRSPETLRELDEAAIAYYKVSKAFTIEREHSFGVCNENSCPFCQRAREKAGEEEVEEKSA
jgi:hypothetical protein